MVRLLARKLSLSSGGVASNSCGTSSRSCTCRRIGEELIIVSVTRCGFLREATRVASRVIEKARFGDTQNKSKTATETIRASITNTAAYQSLVDSTKNVSSDAPPSSASNVVCG